MEKIISCRIPQSLYERLDKMAKSQDRKVSYLVRKFIEAGIKNQSPKESISPTDAPISG